MLLVPGVVFSRTWTVVDFKVCGLCNVAFVACNSCNQMQQMQHCWDLCNITAIFATLQRCCIHLLHVISETTATLQRLHEACNKCNIVSSYSPPPILLMSSPKDCHAFDVIMWKLRAVTMAATMARTIASIIVGRQRRWVITIATPKVIVARPATVIASFLRIAGFKTGDGGGTHIQPPPQGQHTCRPPLDQALKLKDNTLLCGLEYNAIM
jgi:hypothetical protein